MNFPHLLHKTLIISKQGSLQIYLVQYQVENKIIINDIKDTHYIS